ncbi:PAS domain S-box protein [Oxalobacteraceae bacterium]|nr:PAS domain S-box protein [Oxalobacteraceae bacterium]
MKKTPPVPSSPYLPTLPSVQKFPIVGVGASAGGLQALKTFFANLPSDPGMAFVVVMHLSPTHASNASAILQRETALPVTEVLKPVHIEKNTVYVISPNKHLEMVDGYLRVLDRKPGHGQPVAIDQFFRTLANAHGDRAIGIILSGTGSDGANSLSLLKDQGGVVIVQDPEQAEYSGMPHAAIETGQVDFVLPVEAIPRKLNDLWRNAQQIRLPLDTDSDTLIGDLASSSASQGAEEALRDILNLLRSRTGHDFYKYKRATVLRRLERRLQVREVPNLQAYRDLLKEDPAESHALLGDLLIGVTQFFRDREAFEVLERDIIPALFADKSSTDQLRVWTAACSTGEETYSLAILLAEYASRLAAPPELQIFGSDIDDRAITQARAGLYPQSIADEITPARLAEYFNKEDSHFRIKKTLRDNILFASHNLLRDPPFSKLDLISCRNVLIYLNRDTHAQVLEMFHFALNPNGYLFLGSSESADTVAEFFVPVDKKNRIYRAKPVSRLTRTPISMSVEPAMRAATHDVLPVADKHKLSFSSIHQRVLAESAPPSVLVDVKSDIVHMSEGTSEFLRHIAGEPSRNLIALVEPELRLELRTALFRATQTGKSVETRRIRMERGGRLFFVNITARPFFDANSSSDFVLVIFHQVEQTTDEMVPNSEGVAQDAILSGLEEDLQRTKAQLQDTIEHSETSNEELKASNEELQAINEELRSATEELETSKEELQSVNEELVTVNHELKNKIEETSKVNDDLQNLIASTDFATVFVDRGMRIKRYTPRTADLFNIIPGDVGRSLHDITHKLDYPELANDALTSFETLRAVEREVLSEDGRWFIARLLPYRTVHDRIDGAVLTFIDITKRRHAEEKMRASEERMRLVADSTKDYAIITTNREGLITSFNSGAERMFGYTEDELLGKPDDIIFTPEDRELGVPQDEKQRAREDGRAEDERWHLRKDGSRFYCSGVMTPLADGEFYGYAKIGRDLTGRLEQEKQRAEQLSREQLKLAEAESANALKDEFLAIMSHELKHPLNLIHLNAELLLRIPEIKQSPLAAKAADTIRGAANSQAKIINDLLDLSRLNTGTMTLATRDLDLRDTLASLVDLLRSGPTAAALSFSTAFCEQAVVVRADPLRIEQVIWNLLDNAIKFTPAGGAVAVSLRMEENFARIDVSDTGRGIAADFLPAIFDLSGQGTAVIKRGSNGLGIGLALVRQIMGLHGGRVSASSAGIGLGAQFSIWLPLAKAHLPGGNGAEPEGGSAISGKRLLVVEDNVDALDSFRTLLEMSGAEVAATTDPFDALSLLDRQRFDLVISDIGMPRMDGYTFIRKLRQHQTNGALPAIAITAFGRQSDVRMALEAGFDRHISKPMEIEHVIQIAGELLDKRG